MGVLLVMTSNAKPEPNSGRIPSKVKGPVRCHKCQLLCRDAEHYLNHTCGN